MIISEKEALLILHCNHKNEVDDAFENQLFEIKSKFLKIIPPIPLIEKYFQKLEKIQQAYRLFYPLKGSIELLLIEKIEEQNFQTYLKEYQNKIAQIKLFISNAETIENLLNIISQLIQIQKDLANQFLILYSPSFSLYLVPIKISENIDIFKVQEELKSNFLENESQIKDYICKNIEHWNESPLTKIILQSYKVINYGRPLS